MIRLVYGYGRNERVGVNEPPPRLDAFSDVAITHGYGRGEVSSLGAFGAFGEWGDFAEGDFAATNDYNSYDGIVSPSEILSKAQLVDATVQSLNTDADSATLDPNTTAGWADFYNSWTKFYGSLQGAGGWLTRLWGAAMDQVEQYQAQVNSWQKTLAAKGASVTGPPIADPSAGSWKPLLYGGIALAALVLGIKVVGLFGAVPAFAGHSRRGRKR